MTEHFSDAELRCRCGCGRQEMKVGFMALLEALRKEYGKPMIVSSAFRCPEHNNRVSTTGRDGPHTTGKAIDILVSGNCAFRLIKSALFYGFTGIGISQKGPHAQRFIHLDALNGTLRPRVWSY